MLIQKPESERILKQKMEKPLKIDGCSNLLNFQ
jgi:hypothetical protein